MSFTQFATSAGGHPLYLVTIQKKWESKAAKQRWLDFIALQTTDPDKARGMLKKGGDLRAPVFINCSIHGGETTGVDAGLRLIRKLSLSNDSTTKKILANDVVMFNVCQNPDGRITDTRRNANGFDLNRDWVTQSQPEVQAVAKQIVKWHPTMFLDLHGYYDPMIIDPTTNPHDPNYEWDLSIAYALPAAQAIEKAIEDNTIVEVDIPYRDWINPDTGKSEGFEDYSPYYTPQFAMFYGLVGSTMETSFKSEDGVDAHYYGILEGAKYTAANRVGMLTNQIKRFQRANNGQVAAGDGRRARADHLPVRLPDPRRPQDAAEPDRGSQGAAAPAGQRHRGLPDHGGHRSRVRPRRGRLPGRLLLRPDEAAAARHGQRDALVRRGRLLPGHADVRRLRLAASRELGLHALPADR